MSENNQNSNNLLNAYEVSRYLRIPLGTVYRLTYTGKIKAVKIGKHWRYRRADIERYLSFGTDFSREPIRLVKETPEKRTYPRINSNFKCNYSVSLPPFKEINSRGIIKNISTGGVLLINQQQEIKLVTIDDPLNLRFTLPEGDSGGVDIEIKGKVVRKTLTGLGIKFRNISPENKSRITQYIG